MNFRLAGLTFVLFAAFSLSAKACCLPVLLTITIDYCSDTATITSTGANSAINDCSSTENDGIDLRKFFTEPIESDPGFCGSLTPSGGDLPYNYASTDDAKSCGSYVDLNLYTSEEDDDDDSATQSFSKCSPAFTGSCTIDLSEFDLDLPCVGASGDILAGYYDDGDGDGSLRTLGLWEVVAVPEPSHYGFLAVLAFAGMIGSRRLLASRRTFASA